MWVLPKARMEINVKLKSILWKNRENIRVLLFIGSMIINCELQ